MSSFKGSFQLLNLRLLFFALTILLGGCTTTQIIYLKRDGSALVFSTEDTLNQMHTFYKSDQIKGLTLDDKIGIQFTIKSIDSLGNYLSPVFKQDHFHFKYFQDTLFAFESDGKAFLHDFCSNSIIEIKSEMQISSILTKNKYVKQKGDKVIISKRAKKFKYDSQNLNLQIVFDCKK